jgi:cob(I)alamin adenosyltransferase
MPKIYTRTGDEGETALVSGGRVRKDDCRVEAMGSIDELNAALGVVRAELSRAGTGPAGLDALLARLQHQLFDLGAELATPGPRSGKTSTLTDGHVTELEAAIDAHESRLAPLQEFILPGGAPAAAALHVARGTCRRAERRMVGLASEQPVRGELLRYVNRLSDLLFVLARAVNQAHRQPDVAWQQDGATGSG